MNPNATVLMVFGTSLGYTIANMQGAAIGLAVVSGIVTIISFFGK